MGFDKELFGSVARRQLSRRLDNVSMFSPRRACAFFLPLKDTQVGCGYRQAKIPRSQKILYQF